MRIVMIGPFGLAPKGTMRARALPLARELAAQGHQILLLMPPWHTPTEAGRQWEEEGVSCEYIPLGPRLFWGVVPLALVRRALRWQPDVVHCFKPKGFSGLAGWLLWHLSKLGKRRFRLIIDEDDWEGPGGWNELENYPPIFKKLFAWQERWGLRHNDALTVASRTLESLAWSLGVKPTRVHYLPNGVGEWPAGSGDRIRKRFGLQDEPIVLLYTRFFEYDPERPLLVLRHLLHTQPSARLLVVGKALFQRDEQRFRALLGQFKLQNRVFQAGWVPFEELPDYMAAADIALYPLDDTLINRSKCPVKLAELLAAGVPVVADAVGQAREYIIHRETGLLVPPGDTQAMAEAAGQLLAEPALRHAIGQAARERMQQLFTWKRLAKKLLEAYRLTEAPQQ